MDVYGWPGYVCFLIGNIRVCTGKVGQSTITPAFFKESNTGQMPAIASGFSGYSTLHGRKSDYGVITISL